MEFFFNILNYFNILRNIFLILQIFLFFYIFVISDYKKNLIIYFFIIIVSLILITNLINKNLNIIRPISYLCLNLFEFCDNIMDCKFINKYCTKIFYDSFPSRHTTFSVFMSWILITKKFNIGLFSWFLTFIIIIFSLLSLKHWIFDIIFGILIGTVLFFISYVILDSGKRFNIYQR